RDLGYSIIIGLILLAVAGSLSETLTFGPFIILFLAIALPVMVLDYRSRLRLPLSRSPLPPATTAPPGRQSEWSHLVLLFVLVVGLGLTFFAAMPRFPGYQLQTFPVNAPGDFDNLRFEGESRGIVNPGTEGEGDSGTAGPDGSGTGESIEQIYYGFSQTIDQTGAPETPAEPTLVMRVRSQAPGFWRVLAFDRYTGGGWEVSRDDQTLTLQRPSWSYRYQLSLPDPPPRDENIIQTYTIVADMPNLVPLLSHPRVLYFPTPEIAIDPEGSIRAPAPLSENLTYTVISDVPMRDRQRLGQAPQQYPERISKYYLQLPEGVAEEVRPIAEELIASADRPLENPYEIALFLAQALKQDYRINPDIFILPGMDVATAFLNQGGGYPDQFSTTLTVMLRSLGIPARLAAGFGPGQFNPFTGFYLVQDIDAFTLTEVFFPGQGWYTFDPIPGHEVIPTSFVDNETFGPLRQAWSWVAGWLPSPLRAWLTQTFTLVMGGLIRLALSLWRWMSQSVVQFLVGLVALTSTGFGLWLASLGLGRWWRSRRWGRLPAPERVYRQMLWLLASKGDRKSPAQAPWEYARACRSQYPEAIATPIEQITQAYLRWRYNQQNPDLDELQAWLKGMRRSLRLRNPT
ncbi:MAG: transglutaminase TgpA family protein, partial [Spirulinaceae cyanobacterium]